MRFRAPDRFTFTAVWNNRILTGPTPARPAIVTLLAAIKAGFAGFATAAVITSEIRWKWWSWHYSIEYSFAEKYLLGKRCLGHAK